MKKVVLAVPLLALALGGTTACATKKFVRGEVGQVNNKVDTLSRSLEETQERTKANEARDRRSRPEGRRRRSEGRRSRPERRGGRRGGCRRQHPRRRDRKGVQADRLRSRPERREGQLQVRPGDDARDVTPELDQLVQQLKANPNGAFIEIEGHTDNVGNKDINYKLGLERAENVKRYLYETHQVPLHKINVISYGEEKPVGDNKTKDGRAQNRRVVIKVLA